MEDPTRHLPSSPDAGQEQPMKNMSNHEVRIAMAEGHLEEVEKYLDFRRENPTPSQNEMWWEGTMAILYHHYQTAGNTEALQRLLLKLPENIQVGLKKRDPQQTT